RVREKSFGGGISDRLKVSGPQQPAHRAAKALVIINNRDIDVSGAAHRIHCITWEGRCLLPFREGRERDETRMESRSYSSRPPTSIHNFVSSATEYTPSLVVMAVRWSFTVRSWMPRS